MCAYVVDQNQNVKMKNKCVEKWKIRIVELIRDVCVNELVGDKKMFA